MTDRQRAILAAIARGPHGSSADQIAARLGYKPARNGRLAVAATLRRMVALDTNCGEFVTRHPPRDQWSPTTWCLTPAGREAAGVQ